MNVKNNELYFAKVKDGAIIPTKDDENAGYDFYACFEEDYLIIPSLETKLIPTGIACAMSNDYYMQIEERGSTGGKGIKKSAGVVDPSYRGEVFIAITNCTNKCIVISKITANDLLYKNHFKEDDIIIYPYEKAIAQGIIHKVETMDIKEISYDKLISIPSKRGSGALGSSGK